MTTRHFAVIGDPVSHSASPRMHRAAFAALGVDGAYDAIRATDGDLPGLFAQLRKGELDGLNVTIPLKRRVLDAVDEVHASAAAVGAGNTLVRGDDGRIVAHNTDVAALAAEIRELAPGVTSEDWGRTHAVILGTGATARSALIALASHVGVARITFRGRALADVDRHRAFAAETTEIVARTGRTTTLAFEPWEPHPTTDREVRVFLQATSVGMAGGDRGDLVRDVVAWDVVSPEAVALDVVYGGFPTAFLDAARARGLRASDGRGMLARQGALAFALWWGTTAPTAIMHAALESGP